MGGMRKPRAALVPALLLAGCDWGSSVDLRNESGSVVAAQIRRVAAEQGFAQPGRWVTSITLKQVDVTGMPEAALAHLKKGVGKPKQAEICLRPEDIQRGGFYVGEENAACRYERFRMGQGRIEGSLRCADQMGTRAMAMSGSYGPSRYDLVLVTDAQSKQAGQGKASVTMAMEAHRTGPCRGNEGQLPAGLR